MNSWQDVSEVVAGRLLSGALASNAIDPDNIIEPYDAMVRLMQKHKKAPASAEIIALIGIRAYQAAQDAHKATAKTNTDWVALLNGKAVSFEVGQQMIRDGEKLRAGETVDVGRTQAAIARLDKGQRRLTPMTKVDSVSQPFATCGYEPWDTHIGGVPVASQVVIGGETGTGKTSLLLKIAGGYANKGKKFAIYSYEMASEVMKYRAWQVWDKTVPVSKRGNVYICDDYLTPYEVIADLSKHPDVDAFGIDFADLCALTLGDVSESTMSSVYWTFQRGSHQLGMTSFVLSQFNRGDPSELPKLARYRYSGAAEQSAALAVLLYNQGATYSGNSSNETLPYSEGAAWQIVAKSRFGFEGGKTKHQGTGAIQVEWKGKQGWGDKSYRWQDLHSY